MSPARQLKVAAVQLDSEEVILRRIIDAHGEATLGGVLTVLSIPCLIPSSGIGWVLSLGFFAIAVAMLSGSEKIHLPERVDKLPIKKRTAQKFLLGLARLYVRAGRIAKPRWTRLTSRTAQRWLSLLVFVMGFIIFLPIPGGNTLPAISLVLLGPALIFRDGFMVIASLFAGLLAIVLTAGAVYAIGWSLLTAVQNYF
jgi:hypothetical protein